MSCISRTAAHPLTANQQGQLLQLLAAGAVSQSYEVTIYQLQTDRRHAMLPNTLVIGALRDKGLAMSRVRSHAKSQATVYWLSPEGVDRARALLAEKQSGGAAS